MTQLPFGNISVAEPPYVYICGAGPGAVDLLTLRAYRLIASPHIDVVLYDRLIGDDVLALIPDSVRKVYAGKSYKSHAMSQEAINAALVSEASSGRVVLRLKGGDPFLFGRGGEEAQALRAAGIGYEVIAGVTAASAVGAACGVPITHRGVASSVRFMTGHSREGGEHIAPYDPEKDKETTFVIYMGLSRIEEIADNFLSQGMAPTTPCMAVTSATLPHQRQLFSTLKTLAKDMRSQNIVSPCLVVIGEVTGLGL